MQHGRFNHVKKPESGGDGGLKHAEQWRVSSKAILEEIKSISGS
jgi:hypothetical protein